MDRLADIRDKIHGFINRGTNLVLFGPAGTGKDHLAASLLWQAAYLGARIAAFTGPQLWSRTRDLIGDGGSESQLLNCLREPNVVLISDPTSPGKSLTDAQADWLYRIVDRRYRDLKPTWLTANVADRKDAETKLTVQVWDRLRDGAVTVDCNWPSYRKPERQI